MVSQKWLGLCQQRLLVTVFADTVKFGDVVLQPPELTVQPRRSTSRDAVCGDQVMQGAGIGRVLPVSAGEQASWPKSFFKDCELLHRPKPSAIFSSSACATTFSFLSLARNR